MPWWGNSSLANQFATQVGGNFAFPNYGIYSPLFADRIAQATADDPLYWLAGAVYTYDKGLSSIAALGPNSWPAHVWAQVEPGTSVPGPLPILGAAAAFGFSRKLRRRIQLKSSAA